MSIHSGGKKAEKSGHKPWYYGISQIGIDDPPSFITERMVKPPYALPLSGGAERR
uniref:Uncharacterized protein n=1 Tax=Podoviridae sp. ctO1718 TaxID=2827733 RepID=A0A8S5TLU4_9CAUD|nr:MAG TPA: hypothetical protein [Podoviridae sp. ctO1718]